MRFIPLFAMLVLACTGHAQYPARAIKIVVPYAAGGLPDTMTRAVTPKLGESLGQPVVVENMGGAGGISGVTEVARSQPDGYTLLVADVGQIAINPHLFSKLPYAPLKDLAPVSLIGTSPLYLVAHPSCTCRTKAPVSRCRRSSAGRWRCFTRRCPRSPAISRTAR